MKKNLLSIAITALLSLTLQAQTIWNGPTITFSKTPFANPALPANQDRITSGTWITRGNTRGIYNIASEAGYLNNISPANTEWATGTLANYASLSYQPWEVWSGGQGNVPNIVGVDAVLHLIAENIYIGIKFTAWGATSAAGGSFSYERTTAGITTPVKLAGFSASRKGNGIELKWTTASEENVEKFQVERSANGKDFVPIGSVAAAGNSSEERRYYFTDDHPLANNFYRIQSIDRDRKSSLSSVVAFRLGRPRVLDVFPVPATTTLFIQLGIQEATKLQLVDISGIVRKTVMAPAGETSFSLPISDLNAGIYFLVAGAERKMIIKK